MILDWPNVHNILDYAHKETRSNNTVNTQHQYVFAFVTPPRGHQLERSWHGSCLGTSRPRSFNFKGNLEDTKLCFFSSSSLIEVSFLIPVGHRR